MLHGCGENLPTIPDQVNIDSAVIAVQAFPVVPQEFGMFDPASGMSLQRIRQALSTSVFHP